jgi:hypothetical protein
MLMILFENEQMEKLIGNKKEREEKKEEVHGLSQR